MDGYVVAPGVLHASQHEDLRAARRHLEHFLVADAVDLAGARDDARVGGEDAIDIGVDLTGIRAERGRECDGGRVRAAAAERGDVLGVLRDALEPGDDRDVALADRVGDPARGHVDDPGAAVGRVGDHTGLRAGEGPRFEALVGDRHGQQRHRDPLTRGQQHVELARRRQR
jgi:hypothetical protein